MAKTRILNEFGMGSSLRRMEEAMLIDVEIGVQNPAAVDAARLLEVFPYGQPVINVVKGGLDVPKPDGSGVTVIANAAICVSFDMEEA